MKHTTADDSGRFSIQVAGTGRIVCYCTHPFGQPKFARVDLSEERHEFVVRLAAASVIVVKLSGRAVARFRVSVMPYDPKGRRQHPESFEGENNRCRCEGIPTAWGRALVQVDLPDGSSYSAAEAVRLRPMQAVEVVVHVGEGATVVGRVLDERGAPVTGARVYLYFENPAIDSRFTSVTRWTGPDGRFTLAGIPPEGNALILISKRDFVTTRKPIEIREVRVIDAGDSILRRGVRVRGWVLSPQRPGIPRDLTLAVRVQSRPESARYSGTAGWAPKATVESDGSFELRNMRPGTLELAVVRGSPPARRAAWNLFRLDAPSDLDGVVLELHEDVVWSGRLTRRGASLPAAEVLAKAPDGTWLRTGKLHGDGSVEVPVYSFPFVLGVDLKAAAAGRASGGLRWIGTVRWGDRFVAWPEYRYRIETPDGFARRVAFFELEYEDVPAVGRAFGTVQLARRSEPRPYLEIDGLLPGSYRLIAHGRRTRHRAVHRFEIAGDRKILVEAWPFR